MEIAADVGLDDTVADLKAYIEDLEGSRRLQRSSPRVSLYAIPRRLEVSASTVRQLLPAFHASLSNLLM